MIEEKLSTASDKSALVQRDPKCSGHASIKIASDDDPAHVLRYKTELESELPYLSAFQCGLAYYLRSLLGTCSGLHLCSIMYAAFKQFAPHEDVGIYFSKEYEAAIEMRGQ